MHALLDSLGWLQALRRRTYDDPPEPNQPTNLWSNVTAINGPASYVTADYKYGGYSSSALAGWLCLLSVSARPPGHSWSDSRSDFGMISVCR